MADGPGGWRRAGAALGYRDYRLFWIGAGISGIGSWMQNITVPYVLFQLTGSGFWVGMAVVAQVLPSILLNPISGSLADRFSHRNQLRLAQAVAGLATFALAGLWAGGLRSPTAILLLVAVSGTAMMVVQPAWQAFAADLVPPEHLLNALTLNAAQSNAARAVGPAIGGVILATLGPGWAFLLNACSFVVVLGALALLHPPEKHGAPPAGRVLTQYREAAAYARRQPAMLVAYALTAVVCGIGYPVFQLAALFATEVYDVGPGWYGALTGAYGVGAVTGAVLLGAVGASRPRSDILRFVLVVNALALVGMGLSTTFWVGAPMLALVGAGSLCVVATLNTAVQSAAPPGLRGRLLALWILSYTASYPLGSLVQGTVAEHVGVRPTVTAAGLLTCVAAAVLLRRPALARTLDARADTLPVDPTPAA